MLFTMFSMYSIFFIFIKIEQQGAKQNSRKKENKQRNEQPCTLSDTLVLQTMSSPLRSYF
jgi:hypothetical protein